MTRKPLGRLIVAGVAAGVAATVIISWTAGVAEATDPVARVWADWAQFHLAGVRLLEGAWDVVYPGAATGLPNPNFPDRLYFLYPPFVLPMTAPFGAVGPFAAYLLSVTTVVVTTGLGLTLLGRALPASPLDHSVVALCALASPMLLSAVTLGHLSSLVFGVAVVGLWCWKRSWPLATGLVLSLLIAKPNLGLPIGLMVLVVGERRMTLGFAVGSAALLASSLALPLELWSDWWLTMQRYAHIISNETPPWKQLTLLASLQWVTGSRGTDLLVRGAWVVAALLLFAWLLWTSRGRGETSQWRLERLYGTAWLAVVALNPYAYFYDGLALIIPAAVWWLRREHYRSRPVWWAIAVILAVVFVWEHVVIWAGRSLWEATFRGPSPVGLLLTIWLVLELWDTRGWIARGPPPRGPASRSLPHSPRWRLPFLSGAAEP
jgi:hypothetical protein